MPEVSPSCIQLAKSLLNTLHRLYSSCQDQRGHASRRCRQDCRFQVSQTTSWRRSRRYFRLAGVSFVSSLNLDVEWTLKLLVKKILGRSVKAHRAAAVGRLLLRAYAQGSVCAGLPWTFGKLGYADRKEKSCILLIHVPCVCTSGLTAYFVSGSV
jgi:hypothetical protein